MGHPPVNPHQNQLKNFVVFTVNSLYSEHRRDLELVSSLVRVRNGGRLLIFSQTSVIYFCPEFGCCPNYRGVGKARVDSTYFGCGKREAFKQDIFILMLLVLSSRGCWEFDRTPYYGLFNETLLKRPSIFLRLEVFKW